MNVDENAGSSHAGIEFIFFLCQLAASTIKLTSSRAAVQANGPEFKWINKNTGSFLQTVFVAFSIKTCKAYLILGKNEITCKDLEKYLS